MSDYPKRVTALPTDPTVARLYKPIETFRHGEMVTEYKLKSQLELAMEMFTTTSALTTQLTDLGQLTQTAAAVTTSPATAQPDTSLIFLVAGIALLWWYFSRRKT